MAGAVVPVRARTRTVSTMRGAAGTTGTTGRARGLRAVRPRVERERVTAAGHEVVLTRLTPADGGTGAVPVVLVHGIGVSGRYFGPLARELALEGPVLVPDLPGFGASPRPDEPLTIADHAAVLTELVRREGWTAPVLVGHSMGAQVVTEAAAATPGLASGVVLVGPVAEPGKRSVLHQGWRLLRDGRHETARANWVVMTDYLRTGPRWYAATLPHMLDYPLEERIAAVREPVLLVRGGNDPIAQPEFLERLAARAADARVDEVPGEGHVVMMRSPRTAAAMCRSLP